jgi:hypothetical protein
MKLFQHFPLETAFLCANCGEVGSRSQTCACCESRSLISLAKVLNHKEPLFATYDVEQALYAIERMK